MARIRSIKPTFWTDEKVVELTPWARLFFIGLWNFVDDYGRMEYSPKRLKMQIFPGDAVEIGGIARELVEKGMVSIYEVEDKWYLQVLKFEKHQKVDTRTPSRIPAYINGSAKFHRKQSLEGKGLIEPRNGEEGILASANADVAKPAVPPCPHEEIIDLYHEILPMGRTVNKKLWNGTRAKHLQARWREDKERQNVLWWGKFFHFCSESPFLTGKVPPRQGREPFQVALDWLVSPDNFVKVHEGTYHR